MTNNKNANKKQQTIIKHIIITKSKSKHRACFFFVHVGGHFTKKDKIEKE